MNDKDTVWFKISDQVTPGMEEAMLEKYKTKKDAILHWWGRPRHPSDPDYWELRVAKHWYNTGSKIA